MTKISDRLLYSTSTRSTAPHPHDNPEAAGTRSKGAIAKSMSSVKEAMISVCMTQGCQTIAEFADEVYEEVENIRTRAQAEVAVKEVLDNDPSFQLAGGVDESLDALWIYKYQVKVG